MLLGVCFWSLTLMLSAGKEMNAVITEDKIAEMFNSMGDPAENRGPISSVIISVPASWPTLMSSTRSIVISMPLHSFKNPSSFTILVKALNVLLYAFWPVVTEACLRIRATSKGLPTMAPNTPLKAEMPTFSNRPILLPFLLRFSTAQV